METKTFNQQLVTQKQSGLGIAGMVIGIISILLSCIIVGGFLGIIGLILSICGVAAKNRKIGTAIAGTVLNSLAILMMIFMLVFSSSDEKDTVENVPNSTTKNIEQEQIEKESEQSNQAEIFRMGETAEYRDVQVTMTNVQESFGSQYNAPNDGNVFVLVEFEIANNSDKELAISSLISFSAYQDSYSTNLSLSALMEKEGEQLDGSIAPGKKMKGCIGYEIPDTCKELEIHVQPSLWSGKDMVFLYER